MPQIRGFLRRFHAGQPVRSVADVVHHNRVADVLENIEGVGCRIDKPRDGRPWRIVVDGSSDVIIDGLEPPWGQSYPWGENYTFGITQTAADKLKVWQGKLRRWGDQVYTAADTEVTFSADGDFYIVWRWSTSGLEIVTTPQANAPAESDSTYIYGIVHKVNLTSGTFTLLDAVQCGIINAPIFSKAGV